jgi:putative ABC transport system ATP-binding protein
LKGNDELNTLERSNQASPTHVTDSVIVGTDLSHTWKGSAIPCVDLPVLRIEAGESVYLQGESGAGKSTLMALLGAFLPPTSGDLTILGVRIPSATKKRRDQLRADDIGVLVQDLHLIPYLSVLDNVLLPCHFSKRRRERLAARQHTPEQDAIRLLERLDLDRDLWTRPVGRLSGGQKQRVAAARSLIGSPPLILADEPTSALDLRRQREFLELLLEEVHGNGSTLVVAGHDTRLADRLDRIIALQTGSSLNPGVAS